MVHPLKEGLRPMLKDLNAYVQLRQNGTSTKRRIKTDTGTMLKDLNAYVRMVHPLKEGLRPVHGRHGTTYCTVRMVHPLKEGLRLSIFQGMLLIRRSQNGTSTKRRIKTGTFQVQ